MTIPRKGERTPKADYTIVGWRICTGGYVDGGSPGTMSDALRRICREHAQAYPTHPEDWPTPRNLYWKGAIFSQTARGVVVQQ
jgi:hypothetical protein